MTVASNDSTQIISEAQELAAKSKFASAIEILKQAHKRRPLDFEIALAYGITLGNFALSQSGSKANKMQHDAIRLLRKLSRRLRKRSADDRWKVLRHLYYFSGKDILNYRLGLKEVLRGNKMGLLSQGIGAGCRAFKLLQAGKMNQATRWAVKAEKRSRSKEKTIKQMNAFGRPHR